MAYRVDVPNLAAGMNNSVIHLELHLLTPCRVGYFPDSGLIIRMDALRKCFESRLSTVRVKTQHAITFLGPVPDFARGGHPCGAGSHRTRRPTTCVAEPLRLRQVCLALPQGVFRQLTLNSHTRKMGYLRDDFLVTRIGTARLPIVHGKGSDHFAFRGDTGRIQTGPSR